MYQVWMDHWRAKRLLGIWRRTCKLRRMNRYYMCKAFELEQYKKAIQPVKFSRLIIDTLRFWRILAHRQRLSKEKFLSEWRFKTAAWKVSHGNVLHLYYITLIFWRVFQTRRILAKHRYKEAFSRWRRRARWHKGKDCTACDRYLLIV